MRVLFIEGDGDYDAMTIEEMYTIDSLVALLENKVNEPYALERQDGDVYFSATIIIKEFGDVDPAFIDFMLDNYVDYDTTKARNFHILRDEPTTGQRLKAHLDEHGAEHYAQFKKEDAE